MFSSEGQKKPSTCRRVSKNKYLLEKERADGFEKENTQMKFELARLQEFRNAAALDREKVRLLEEQTERDKEARKRRVGVRQQLESDKIEVEVPNVEIDSDKMDVDDDLVSLSSDNDDPPPSYEEGTTWECNWCRSEAGVFSGSKEEVDQHVKEMHSEGKSLRNRAVSDQELEDELLDWDEERTPNTSGEPSLVRDSKNPLPEEELVVDYEEEEESTPLVVTQPEVKTTAGVKAKVVNKVSSKAEPKGVNPTTPIPNPTNTGRVVGGTGWQLSPNGKHQAAGRGGPGSNSKAAGRGGLIYVTKAAGRGGPISYSTAAGLGGSSLGTAGRGGFHGNLTTTNGGSPNINLPTSGVAGPNHTRTVTFGVTTPVVQGIYTTPVTSRNLNYAVAPTTPNFNSNNYIPSSPFTNSNGYFTSGGGNLMVPNDNKKVNELVELIKSTNTFQEVKAVKNITPVYLVQLLHTARNIIEGETFMMSCEQRKSELSMKVLQKILPSAQYQNLQAKLFNEEIGSEAMLWLFVHKALLPTQQFKQIIRQTLDSHSFTSSQDLLAQVLDIHSKCLITGESCEMVLQHLYNQAVKGKHPGVQILMQDCLPHTSFYKMMESRDIRAYPSEDSFNKDGLKLLMLQIDNWLSSNLFNQAGDGPVIGAVTDGPRMCHVCKSREHIKRNCPVHIKNQEENKKKDLNENGNQKNKSREGESENKNNNNTNHRGRGGRVGRGSYNSRGGNRGGRGGFRNNWNNNENYNNNNNNTNNNNSNAEAVVQVDARQLDFIKNLAAFKKLENLSTIAPNSLPKDVLEIFKSFQS